MAMRIQVVRDFGIFMPFKPLLASASGVTRSLRASSLLLIQPIHMEEPPLGAPICSSPAWCYYSHTPAPAQATEGRLGRLYPNISDYAAANSTALNPASDCVVGSLPPVSTT
ncbi:hypothetical protein BGW80DRAFT_1254602 [Lactifluus volemus]|nr:hypothetical protein BGW80DRAFT_1254602 [Lactifluus volemus]